MSTEYLDLNRQGLLDVSLRRLEASQLTLHRSQVPVCESGVWMAVS